MAGWRTAANVASDFDYSLDHYIVQAAVLLVAYLFLVWACPAQRRRDRMPRLAGALLILFGAGYSFAFFCTGMLPALGIYTQQWVTQANGFLLNFTVAMRVQLGGQAGGLQPGPGAGAGGGVPGGRGGRLRHPAGEHHRHHERVLRGPDHFEGLELEEDPTPFLHSMTENTIKGWMYSPVTRRRHGQCGV